jgi:hypothetical protein
MGIMETRVAGKDVGNGEGGKSNGNGNEVGNCKEEGNERKRQSGEKVDLADPIKFGGGGRPTPPDSGGKSKKDKKVFCSII